MVTSRAIHWATLPAPYGRRPVCVLTRDQVIGPRTRITVAPITSTIRAIRSEVPVGAAEGLEVESVINCDNVITVPKAVIDEDPIGMLSTSKQHRLDRALRYALAIRG